MKRNENIFRKVCTKQIEELDIENINKFLKEYNLEFIKNLLWLICRAITLGVLLTLLFKIFLKHDFITLFNEMSFIYVFILICHAVIIGIFLLQELFVIVPINKTIKKEPYEKIYVSDGGYRLVKIDRTPVYSFDHTEHIVTYRFRESDDSDEHELTRENVVMLKNINENELYKFYLIDDKRFLVVKDIIVK